MFNPSVIIKISFFGLFLLMAPSCKKDKRSDHSSSQAAVTSEKQVEPVQPVPQSPINNPKDLASQDIVESKVDIGAKPIAGESKGLGGGEKEPVANTDGQMPKEPLGEREEDKPIFADDLKAECGIEDYQQQRVLRSIDKSSRIFSGTTDVLFAHLVANLNFASLDDMMNSFGNIAANIDSKIAVGLAVEMLTEDVIVEFMDILAQSKQVDELTKIIVNDRPMVELGLDIAVAALPYLTELEGAQLTFLGQKTFAIMEKAMDLGLVGEAFESYRQTRSLLGLFRDFYKVSHYLISRSSKPVDMKRIIEVGLGFIQRHPEVLVMVEEIVSYLQFDLMADITKRVGLSTKRSEFFYYVNSFENLLIDLLKRSDEVTSLLTAGIDLLGKGLFRYKAKFDAIDFADIYELPHPVAARQRCHFLFSQSLLADGLYKTELIFEDPIPLGFNPLAEKAPEASYGFQTTVTIHSSDHPGYNEGDKFTLAIEMAPIAGDEVCPKGDTTTIQVGYKISYKVEDKPTLLSDLGLFNYIAGGFAVGDNNALVKIMHDRSTALSGDDVCSSF